MRGVLAAVGIVTSWLVQLVGQATTGSDPGTLWSVVGLLTPIGAVLGAFLLQSRHNDKRRDAIAADQVSYVKKELRYFQDELRWERSYRTQLERALSSQGVPLPSPPPRTHDHDDESALPASDPAD